MLNSLAGITSPIRLVLSDMRQTRFALRARGSRSTAWIPIPRFYLATIAHCMECHTPMVKGQHNWAADLGRGGFEFPGPWGVSVSRNITSSKTKGIGAWSDAEIKRAITTGVSKDGSHLKPPMGFHYYATLTPGDLDAIVAYLRTAPAKE